MGTYATAEEGGFAEIMIDANVYLTVYKFLPKNFLHIPELEYTRLAVATFDRKWLSTTFKLSWYHFESYSVNFSSIH